MHKYLSPLCKNILQIIITHSNKSSSQILSGPKCWVLQKYQFLFWKITTWKHEELMRNFQYFFFVQASTVWNLSCFDMHLTPTSVISRHLQLRQEAEDTFPLKYWLKTNLHGSNPNFKHCKGGKYAKLAWSQELAPTKQRKRVDSKCEWNTKWSSIGL